MRKQLLWLVTIALIICLAGCSSQTPPVEEADSTPTSSETSEMTPDSRTEDSSTSTEAEMTSSSQTPSPPSETAQEQPAEAARRESTPAALDTSKAGTTGQPQKQTETSQPSASASQTQATPPVQTEPEPEPVSEPEKPASSAPVASEPQESQPAQQETPAFDIDYWIGYAKSYAQSVGLRLEPSAIDCWDNPIGANAKCIYLERDIQSRLNLYAGMEGITDVWIWAEEVSDNAYELYIGYA